MTRKIVVVQAGLGQPSSSRLLADRLAAAVTDALVARGDVAEVTVIDVREHAHALADALLTGFATGALREALDAVAAADGLVVVTPVFQASFSGLFKMFFDVVEEGSLRGTPVVLAATAGTARHSLVLEHALRPMFAHLKAITVPTAVFAASEDWGGAGSSSSGLADRMVVAGEELADLVTGSAQRRTGAADPFADPVPFEQLLGR